MAVHAKANNRRGAMTRKVWVGCEMRDVAGARLKALSVISIVSGAQVVPKWSTAFDDTDSSCALYSYCTIYIEHYIPQCNLLLFPF